MHLFLVFISRSFCGKVNKIEYVVFFVISDYEFKKFFKQ